MTDSNGALQLHEPKQVAQFEEPTTLIGAVMRLAKDPEFDVAKFDALLRMQERMEVRQAEVEFNQALASLPPIRVKKNGRITLPTKTGEMKDVPFARWEDIALIIDPLLAERGFRLTFNSEPRQGDGGGLVVTGVLLHRNGHNRSASMPLPLDTGPGRNNLQAMGSTLSYGKRYCAEMLLNIVREGQDDDGARQGYERITPEQIEELRGGCKETNSAEDAFLNYLGYADFGDIVARDLAKARNALARKRERMGGF